MTSDGTADRARPIGTCAVTGATGYVGSRLVAALAAAGWHVRALSRSGAAPAIEGVLGGHFDLASGPDAGSLDGVDALVHAAWDLSSQRWDATERVNVGGSRRLLEGALDAGVGQIVAVSSIAAFPGCVSVYGRAKLVVESDYLAAGAAVVRPGLVWGQSSGALFAALRKAVGQLPVVPLLAPPGVAIFLIHEADLCEIMVRLLARPDAGRGLLLAAAATPAVPFRQVLEEISEVLGRKPRLVPVPWRLSWAALRAAEILGVPVPFRSDSLVSLVHPNADPFAKPAEGPGYLGLECRIFTAGRLAA